MTSLVAFFFGALAALGVFYFSYRRWRAATAAAMYLLVFEGALRKWIFPAAQEYIYFAKDLVLFAVYLRLFQDGKLNARAISQALGRSGAAIFLLASVWVVVQVANPLGAGIAVGLFGLKTYLFMVPLLVVVPLAFPDRRSLLNFLWGFAAVVIPTGLLATLQFFSSADALVNRYAWSGNAPRVATFHGTARARVTSTFSYITGYASYLSVMAPVLVGLLGGRQQLKRSLILLAGFALVGVNLFMTGSRSPTLVAAAACLLTTSSLSWMRSRRSARLLIRGGLAAAAAYVLVTAVLPTALAAFMQRVDDTSEDVDVRASEYVLAFLPLADWGGLEVSWTGRGTGTAHQATQHISKTAGVNVPEGEFPRIGYELGPVGYVLWWLFRVALLWRAFTFARRLRDPELKPIGRAVVAVMLLNFPGGYVYNPTMQMLLYFLAAIPALLVRFEGTVPISAPRRVDPVPMAVPRGA